MEVKDSLKIDDAVFFYDTLTADKPYISDTPRNHESLFFVKKGSLLYERYESRTEKSEKSEKSECELTQKLGANTITKAVIKQGQVGYIARGSVDKSSAYKCSDVSYVAVNFSFDIHNPKPERTLSFDTVCTDVKFYNFENMFESALEYYNSTLAGSEMICHGILYQIIGILINNQNLKRLTSNKAKKIEKSTKYMEDNFCDPDFRISCLGELSDMSEKQFRRLFLELYDKNPYRFLTERRLNKAKSMLLNTSVKISDIAVECGFSDLYSFSHSFKKYFGISPKAYKEIIK